MCRAPARPRTRPPLRAQAVSAHSHNNLGRAVEHALRHTDATPPEPVASFVGPFSDRSIGSYALDEALLGFELPNSPWLYGSWRSKQKRGADEEN